MNWTKHRNCRYHVGRSFFNLQSRFTLPRASWLGCRSALHPVAEMGGFVVVEKTKNPNPSPIEKRFGFSLFGASSDTELFKNYRSTICFWGHRIATCLYRTPMGSCIEKTVAFYIPHNLKIIKYAQRSLLPSPGANERCFFCLQRKEASVKWQFFG